jgi:uncharacterized protein
MTDKNDYSKPMMILGLLLAVGMASAAFILGVQAKRAVAGSQSISVKGLAEKPIKADRAEWVVGVGVVADTEALALKKLAVERKALDSFLNKQGLDESTWKVDLETLKPHFEEVFIKEKETPRQVQKGFEASQSIRVLSKDLAKITLANKAFLQLRAENSQVSALPPNYLVGDLEAIKMSLISDATKNARDRAAEFVKQDNGKVGAMKSANQGSFYILPAGGEVPEDSYGGKYDKSTIDKTARVVVTIIYNIE